jgi:sugar lactone lactonase YvrE
VFEIVCGWHEWNAELGTTIQFIPYPELSPGRNFLQCGEPYGEGNIWKHIPATAVHEFAETLTNPIPKWPKEESGPASLFTGWAYGPSQSVVDRCVDFNLVNPSSGVWIEKAFDNYLNAATKQDCVAQDVAPVRYEATTGPATSISQATHSAVLNGTVTPAGYGADYQFIVYGLPATLLPPSPASVGEGFSAVPVSQTLTGLKEATTYTYRLVTSSEVTDSLIKLQRYSIGGPAMQFTTPEWLPAITNPGIVKSRTKSRARLNAEIRPNGSATTYRFEYGPTTSYGTNVPSPNAAIGSGTSAVVVSELVEGLKPETTYHFRVVATNAEGTRTGPDRTFTTLGRTPAFVSSTPFPGSSPGTFTRPGGMDPDGEGNVWVTGRLVNRVQKLNAKGEVVAQFGTSGSAPGQLNDPRSVAVGPDGNLWVADYGNARIQEFTPAGTFIRQIGPDESRQGELQQPNELVVPGDGRVYVTDQGQHGVGVFTEEPNQAENRHYVTWIGRSQLANPTGIDGSVANGFLAVLDYQINKVFTIDLGTLALQSFGEAGSGPGQLQNGFGLAVKPNDTILVSDRGNNRIQQFSRTGELLSSFGAPGTGPGQLSEASGLALSSRGVIFVADSNNLRVQRWTQQGTAEATTLAPAAVKEKSATLRAHINPSGLATDYVFEYGPTSDWNYPMQAPAAPLPAGSGFESIIASQPITGLQPEDTYRARIRATNSDGISYGKHVTFRTTKWTHTSSFGSLGTAPGQFDRPLAAAADASGNVWVVDKNNHRLQKFNAKGEFLTQFGTPGLAPGQMTLPSAIAIDPQGDIWITEVGASDRVQEFSPTGTFLRQIKQVSLIDGKPVFGEPSGIAVGADGYVYVTDQEKDNIQKFTQTPNAEGRYPTFAWGGLITPAHMAIDSQGDVWFVDAGSNKVFEMPAGGTPLARFGTTGSGLGQLSAPYAIAFRPSGNMLISERGNNRIQGFTPNGVPVNIAFGSSGAGSGQFNEPSGLAIAGGGVLFVADAANNRVQRWTAE